MDRVFRVGQLDADLLDAELVQLLKDPLNKTLSLLGAGKFDPELTLFIQLGLYKLSVWNTGMSYGARLQDLKYVLGGSKTSHRILLIHGALTIVLPYAHTRLRSHALSNAWPDAPSSDRRRKTWNLLTSLEASYATLALLTFVGFLWDGRFRSVADRILGLRLAPSQRLVKREVSYEFMNRQMVWQAFTEFLVFVLPLFDLRKIRKRFNHLTSQAVDVARIHGLLSSETTGEKRPIAQGKYWSLPEDQCAICAENASLTLDISTSANAFAFATERPSKSTPPPITQGSELEPPPFPIYTPYLTSCRHVYCFHCISERLMRAAEEGAEAGWDCLRCNEMVQSAERLYALDMEVSSEISSDYEFNSDIDATSTDMSASVGTIDSYSESDS